MCYKTERPKKEPHGHQLLALYVFPFFQQKCVLADVYIYNNKTRLKYYLGNTTKQTLSFNRLFLGRLFFVLTCSFVQTMEKNYTVEQCWFEIC